MGPVVQCSHLFLQEGGLCQHLGFVRQQEGVQAGQPREHEQDKTAREDEERGTLISYPISGGGGRYVWKVWGPHYHRELTGMQDCPAAQCTRVDMHTHV